MPVELTDESALLVSRPGEVLVEDMAGLVAGLLVDAAPAGRDHGVEERVVLGRVVALERRAIAVAVAVAAVIVLVTVLQFPRHPHALAVPAARQCHHGQRVRVRLHRRYGRHGRCCRCATVSRDANEELPRYSARESYTTRSNYFARTPAFPEVGVLVRRTGGERDASSGSHTPIYEQDLEGDMHII